MAARHATSAAVRDRRRKKRADIGEQRNAKTRWVGGADGVSREDAKGAKGRKGPHAKTRRARRGGKGLARRREGREGAERASREGAKT
jgi:hypothetical protein